MSRSLLDEVAGLDRRDLISAARRRRFGRGEVLFHEADPGGSLHLVAKGYVAIRVTTPLGDTVTLTVLGLGETFGELALLTPGALRTASAVALSDAETLSWHQTQVEELRAGCGEFDRFLLEVVAAQVTRLTGLLVEALHLPVELRVLRHLSRLAGLYDPDSPTATIPVTQEDLATMAGTTRPSANRVLKEAEGQGFIELTRGRIVVCDRPGLARRAGC
jgi:CRP/FNR family transcriptional regulator, cyclic AMP receptor protein